MAKIDQIQDTDDWNETSGNGFLTSQVPFIEPKIVGTNKHSMNWPAIINLTYQSSRNGNDTKNTTSTFRLELSGLGWTKSGPSHGWSYLFCVTLW